MLGDLCGLWMSQWPEDWVNIGPRQEEVTNIKPSSQTLLLKVLSHREWGDWQGVPEAWNVMPKQPVPVRIPVLGILYHSSVFVKLHTSQYLTPILSFISKETFLAAI